MSDTIEPSFDADALRERYRLERERRYRTDGDRQYISMSGPYADYLDDPHAAENDVRAPRSDDVEVLVIGGGYGGLLAAANLVKRGVDDIMIVEKGSDFGGVWYWNRYPGAACDTESYIYMPLLEDTGVMPTEKYARGPALMEHARTIGRHFGLYEKALFGTEITELRWDEGEGLWHIGTGQGDAIRARYVISVIGSLHRPKLPGIPGIETFEGHSFHTSRWNYDVTGGDALGGLHKLADKKVGLIGTGATAIQCAPHLGRDAEQLFVFQRTPSVVDARNNRPTDPEWVRELAPGWQRDRMNNFNTIVSGGHTDRDLVNDGWTDLLGRFLNRGRGGEKEGAAANTELLELADFSKMEKMRSRVDAIVEDKAVAERLKPYFSLFCKRPCFHDEFLQAFNRPNVSLVDTEGRGVERITPRGVVANGVEYDLDVIVFSTGFEVNEPYTKRAGFQVYGRGGVTLEERFASGPETLHGYFVDGFPNLVLIGQMQGGAAANFTHMLAEQAEHIAWTISEARGRGADTIEADPAAVQEWVETILALARPRLDYTNKCVPGYYNNEGHFTEAVMKAGVYTGGSVAFIELMRSWREAGDLKGLNLGRLPAAATEGARI